MRHKGWVRVGLPVIFSTPAAGSAELPGIITPDAAFGAASAPAAIFATPEASAATAPPEILVPVLNWQAALPQTITLPCTPPEGSLLDADGSGIADLDGSFLVDA